MWPFKKKKPEEQMIPPPQSIASGASAVLLYTKSATPGPIQPCQMKTSSGLSLIGFKSQEVGAYYMRHYPSFASQQDFVTVRDFFSDAPDLAKKRIKIVYFRSEEDVEAHFRDRHAFPYQDFELTAEQIEERG